MASSHRSFILYALRAIPYQAYGLDNKKGTFVYQKFLFCWRRRKDLNLRAGYPTYTLSRGASSPLEYFSIFKLWFISLPNYYIKFFRLCQGLSFKISQLFLKNAKNLILLRKYTACLYAFPKHRHLSSQIEHQFIKSRFLIHRVQV